MTAGFLFAERQGFEPWDPVTGINGFRDRPIRPLWHLSEGGLAVRLAEREGFEPPDPCRSTVFKTAAIDRSAISPATKVQFFSNLQKTKPPPVCSISSPKTGNLPIFFATWHNFEYFCVTFLVNPF